MSETEQTEVLHTPYTGSAPESPSDNPPPLDSRGATFLQMRQKDRVGS